MNNTKSTHTSTMELVFGIHPITELLQAKKRKIFKIFVLDRDMPLVRDIRKRWSYVEVHQRSRVDLTRMADSADHQGIVAYASPFQFRTKSFEPNQHQRLVMLDGIQDPRNVGAILRSAYCTGFSGVIITKKQSAPINAVCIKASAGLAEHLDIYAVPSANAGALELKKNGYTLYVSALAKNAVDATTVDYREPLCIVIGSEGKGVSPELLQQGTVIMLPQKRNDISYNASVAAGILMFFVATRLKVLA